LHSRSGIIIVILLVFPTGVFVPILPAASQEIQPEPEISVRWEQRNGKVDNFSQDTTICLWDMIPGGPEILFSYENGTSLETYNSRIDVNQTVRITVRIKQNILGEEGNGLNVAKILISQSSGNTTANVWLNYWAYPNEHHVYSHVYNSTSRERLDENGIFELNSSKSYIENAEDYYDVHFLGEFIDAAPIGEYRVFQIEIRDKLGRRHLATDTNSRRNWSFGVGCEASSTPGYFLRILDQNLQPIDYAEVDDVVVFEMSLTSRPGFLIFPLGEVDHSMNYKLPVNRSQPVNESDPNTLWTNQTRWESPNLGFTYNHSTDDAQAIIYYKTFSWEWVGNIVSGIWRASIDFIVNNTVLPTFFQFDNLASGLIDQNTVRWQGTLTDSIGKTGSPFPSYGILFNVYKHLPGMLGSSDINGRSLSTGQSTNLEFNYHAILPQLILHNNDSLPTMRVAQEQWFNMSHLTTGFSSIVQGTTQPFQDESGQWWMCETDLNNITITISSDSSWGDNGTYEWNYRTWMQVLVDLEGKSVLAQFCKIENVTRLIGTSEWKVIMTSNSSTGLENLFSINNESIYFSNSENDTTLNLQGWFENQVMNGSYSISFMGDRSITWYNGTSDLGPWSQNRTETDNLYLDYSHRNFVFAIGQMDRNIYTIAKVTDSGAIDLDGVFDTTSDQYYALPVKYVYSEGFIGEDLLLVNITFDPTPSADSVGDECASEGWMGMSYNHYVSEVCWDGFFWYHAQDFSRVNHSELDSIIDRTGIAIRTYDWADRLTYNATDSVYIDQGYTWFGFDTKQEFEIAVDANTTIAARFQSQYSGLQLFNDDAGIDDGNGVPDFAFVDGEITAEESTHFVILSGIADVSFTVPDLLGGTPQYGNVTIGLNETIEFGVELINASGYVFPSCSWLGPGEDNLYDRIYANDAKGFWGYISGNPEYETKRIDIGNIGFMVHYEVILADTDLNPDPYNNIIRMKVDQYIGNWSDHYLPLIGPDDPWFDGRSLATTYFAEFSTETQTEFAIDEIPTYSGINTTTVGDIYRFGAENRTFTEVHMGGQEYIWGKDNQTYDCSSAAVPLDVFSSAYATEGNDSLSLWEIESSYYFLLSGFVNWGGHSIDNDPSYTTFSSALSMIRQEDNGNGSSVDEPSIDLLTLGITWA